MPSYEEFRGTGGSLYFLRHQDILTGSERVRIEIRDKESRHRHRRGQPAARRGLRHRLPAGPVVLSEPLSSTADDNLLVRSTA